MNKTPKDKAKDLKIAIEQIVTDLGMKSPNGLWTKAGVNKADWEGRIDVNISSPTPTTKTQIDNLIKKLRENGAEITYSHHKSLYEAIGVSVEPPGGQNLGAGLPHQADDDLARIVRDYQAALASEFERRYNDFDRLIDLRMQRGKQAPERPRPKGLPSSSVHRLRETLRPGYSSVAPTELKPDEAQSVVTVEQTLAHSPRLALLGAPGAGKSTTLRRLLKQFDPATASQPAAQIPLLVELNRWQDPALPLLDFLVEQTALYSAELANSLTTLIQQGRVLLLLDALNELPQLKHIEKTNEINDPRATEIARFAEEYSQCQVVLTCRVKEFAGGPHWHDLHVLDLNREQVSEFVEVFFEGEADGPTLAQKLLVELYESQNKRKHKLQGLTRQPFYLVRLLAYYYESGDLPDNPALLLKFSVDEALDREFTRRVIAHELTEEAARQERAKLESALALLAFNMTETGQVGAVEQGHVAAWLFHLHDRLFFEQRGEQYQEPQATPSGEAEAMIRQAQGAGLLVENGEQFGFYHQLVQEYFCACYCLSKPFYATFLKGVAFDRFTEIWHIWLGLNKQVLTELISLFETSNDDDLRENTAFILGELGEERAIKVLVSALYGKNLKVSSAASQALGKFGEATINSLLPTLGSEDISARAFGAIVLGNIGKPVLKPLIGILKDQNQESLKRSMAAFALSSLGKLAVEPLLSVLTDSDKAVRGMAIEALGGLCPEGF